MSEIISVKELDAKFNHIPDEVIEKVNYIILTAARNDRRIVELRTKELNLTQIQIKHLYKLLNEKGFGVSVNLLGNKVSDIWITWN